MNTAEKEIKEIFGHLKNLMIADLEFGLDPPPVSKEAIRYLDTKQVLDTSQVLNTVQVSDTAQELKTAQELDTVHEETAVPSCKDGDINSLESLKAYIGDCKRCKLCKARKRLVFGEGDEKARVVFVGEAPGRDEDLEGRPFIGKAGKLLTKIIQNGMGLTREKVYICNVVKCHPPGNRDPEKDETDACLPFLKQQLKIINPEVIFVLGRVAGQNLLGKQFMISRERGKWFEYMDIPLMPTYHPAYLLRNPSAKRQVWDDVKKVMARLGLAQK